MGWLRKLFAGEPRAPEPTLVVTKKEPSGLLSGDHYVEVVGESYRQDTIAKLARARSPLVAELVREPSNQHDPNAVRVDIRGETVGYIARGDAASLHPLLERLKREGQPARVGAQVTGGGEGRYYGVIIDGLPDK